jgi:hypothetical protein
LRRDARDDNAGIWDEYCRNNLLHIEYMTSYQG